MKKITLFTIILFFLSVIAHSQDDKLRSLKVSYLTEQLNLDPQTAERFWPLYRQYENELKSVVQEKRRNGNETRNSYEILDQEQKALDIKRKYNDLFSKVLSNDQVNRLYQSEKEFRQMVINRSQNIQNSPRTNYNQRPREEEIGNRRTYDNSVSPRTLRNNPPIQNNSQTRPSPRPERMNNYNNDRGTNYRR